MSVPSKVLAQGSPSHSGLRFGFFTYSEKKCRVLNSFGGG